MTNIPRKTGILIVNLGTPSAPTPDAVKNYLAEFLWDPYIVQIPRAVWWLILNALILRTRPHKTAKLYQKIWLPQGSPLLHHSLELSQKIQTQLHEQDYPLPVALGMRYGQPAIKDALQILRSADIKDIIVLPLYPQYSTATTGSTKAEINKQLEYMCWNPTVKFIGDYHQQPDYIAAMTKAIENFWQMNDRGQLLIFSFHGLPEKYIKKGDPYYQQCLITAQMIASKLSLNEDQWRLVFQSRFGKEAWLKPYCVEVLKTLPAEGFQKIDMVCPGFPVDCLETLEEIAITNKEIFIMAGGKTYQYIPALNSSERHVQALTNILLQSID